jgi:hypothetical protein
LAAGLLLALSSLAALQPTAAGAETLTLDSSTGSLRVLLYKEGPLGALGHDHVLAAPAFSGNLELGANTAQLMLSIDAASLSIDSTPVRAAEGLSDIKDSDREKIDAGMRGPKGLDVKRFPKITFRSDTIEPVSGEKNLWEVTGRFELHGATQTIDFPVTVSEGPGGRWFTGYVRLRQSEFGIKPFSVFAGAVRVQDEFLVRFTLLGKN